MKRFISFTGKLLLLSLLPLLVFGGDWNKNNYRIGYEYNGLKADSIFISPSDTVKNKRNGSIALLNNKLYVSDGTKWYDSQLNVDTINKIATKYDVSKKLDINGNGSHLTGITKTQVGLSNVDNTSDTNKPISTATQAALNIKEDTLPATPSSPETKYLNGNRQWAEISIGSGGYASNLYPTTISSDISGYYKLSYTNELTQTVRTYTVTNQELKVNTSIYDSGIGVTSIDAGIWMAHMRMYVSSSAGNTFSRAEVFLRHTDGTETTLFSASSTDINNTTSDWVISESNQPAFSCLATDRLGIRHYISTDSHSAVMVYVVIGNGYASYVNTPIAIRHNQLRGLNDDLNYQHITSTQVSGLHTHSNKSALDLVSGTNTGDETLSSIKSKLGAATTSNDGYLTYADWNLFNNKQSALGYTPVNSAAVGAANGVAPLDASAKIPTSYLPDAIVGSVKYKGSLNASWGSYPASPSKGDYYVISTPGTIGSVTYTNGDWAVYNGTSWDAILQGHYVTSVFGRTGAVSAVSGDYNTSQVTESGNLYYTDSRARSALSMIPGSGAYNSSLGVVTIPTNNNQIANGAGYITGNQTITLSGDVTGSGTTAITTTLANSGVTAGTYNNSSTSVTPITVDAKGRVTGTGSAVTITPAWSSITGKPTIVSTEADPVYSASSWAITTNNSGAWNTAVSWGNHASAGYATQSWVTNYISKYSLNATGGSQTWIRLFSLPAPSVVGLSSSFATISINGSAGYGGNLYPSELMSFSTRGSIALNVRNLLNSSSITYGYVTNGNDVEVWASCSPFAAPFSYNITSAGSMLPKIYNDTYTTTEPSGIVYVSTINKYDDRYTVKSGDVFTGNVSMPSITISGGSPSAGKVLTATDASGNCTWQTPGYSSGTWTPTYTGDYTYSSTNTPMYTRIGQQVHAAVRCETLSNASSYQLYITLPFTINTSVNAISAICTARNPAGYTAVGYVTINSANSISVVVNITSGAGNGCLFDIQLDYITDQG